MTMPRWDRIYFFVFSATSFALLSFTALLVIPLVEITDSETGEGIRKTLIADGQSRLLLLSLLPIALSGSALLVVPKDGIPDRAAKINLWVSTFLIYVFVILFILVNGVLFFPTAILMTAAAVGASVRRRKRTIFAKSPDESKSGDGGGKRRRN
ncbi:MAG: hypothetical protein HQ477_00450 [Chloroflexi bacterium]|nr:hypothetical protein [Chloroflexota bacterium]